MELKEQLFTVSILLMWYEGRVCCTKEHNRNLTTGSSDFVQEDKFLTRIAFGSCMNGLFTGSDWYKEPQVVWQQIMRHQPDIWIWLGDATYADTRIIPLIWKPSPLQLMAEYFRRQKHHPDYQEFLKSGVTIVGTWDDHDYGMNDGGKHFKNRLQSQDIYLDFIDEPSDSLRRKREGMYVSYTFGRGDKAVKIIMLDVRSFVIYGKGCDLLGNQQWQWLTEQISDPTHTGLTIITSGIQVLSDGPLLQKWMDCPQSYDRLLWLTQQRDKVIYLSGDVHFGEISCVNSFSSGFPIYDLTSSGLYISCTAPYVSSEVCGWIIRNVIGNNFGIHDPVVERNFGFIDINWDSSPVQIKLQIIGKNSDVASEVIFNLDHIQKQSKAERCLQSNRMKPKFMTIILFWTFIGLLLFAILVIILSLLFLLCKCIFVVLRVLIRCLPFWKSGQVQKKKKL